jgi:hypothetical protein
VVFRSRQSRKFAGAALPYGTPVRRFVCDTSTRSFGRSKGSGRSSTAFTTLKIAVFAPIPTAIVRMPRSVKPGDRRLVRTA